MKTLNDSSNRITREGDFWTVVYGSETLRLKDSKGWRHLSVLLTNPGREFHSMDLVAMAEGSTAGSGPGGVVTGASTAEAASAGLSIGGWNDAGDVIDPKAKAAYRRRLAELEQDFDEAESFHDSGRAARAKAEIDALKRELSAAFGVGGKSRKTGSSAEKARINVRNSIAAALKSLGQHHAELAEDLRKSIRTGTYCWYASEAPAWNSGRSPTTKSQTEKAAEDVADSSAERFLTTLMFTDIVDSTKVAARLGDKKWRRLLDQHDACLREELVRHGGREVKVSGDSFLATFPTPHSALMCAWAMQSVVEKLGISIRVAAHTGECERRGEDIGGIAVHIGARVLSETGSGEVFVSSTVRDLVAGSDIEFEDRGFHELRGVPGNWRLFSVTTIGKGRKKKPSPKTEERKTKVLSLMLVDDHPMWRQTLRAVLEGSGIGTVVAEASDGTESLEMAPAAIPDVVVMDMNLPHMNGVEATRRLLEQNPNIKVLVLSSSDERKDVIESVKAGALGYLLKTAEPAEVADAVLRISKGELVFPPQLAKVVFDEFRNTASAKSRTLRASKTRR